MNNSPDKKHLSEIRWHCRRGMLELDILLENFFDRYYLKLSSEERALFQEILETNDQQLYNWLMGKESPDDPKWSEMINQIRENKM